MKLVSRLRASPLFAVCLVAAVAYAEGIPQDMNGHGTVAHGTIHGGQTDLSPTGMTHDEETAYSLFMHRSSGIALVILGGLILADRLTRRGYGLIRAGIGLVWVLLGVHLFIRADPEGWPMGQAGLLESFSMPTTGEWLQHKLLSLIPLALGVWTLTSPDLLPNLYWTYALVGVMALGGGALLAHQHSDHPEMDLVNLQHRFMALSALFIASGMLADGWERLRWKAKPFLLPCGLIVLGFQLVLYVE